MVANCKVSLRGELMMFLHNLRRNSLDESQFSVKYGGDEEECFGDSDVTRYLQAIATRAFQLKPWIHQLGQETSRTSQYGRTLLDSA